MKSVDEIEVEVVEIGLESFGDEKNLMKQLCVSDDGDSVIYSFDIGYHISIKKEYSDRIKEVLEKKIHIDGLDPKWAGMIPSNWISRKASEADKNILIGKVMEYVKILKGMKNEKR